MCSMACEWWEIDKYKINIECERLRAEREKHIFNKMWERAISWSPGNMNMQDGFDRVIGIVLKSRFWSILSILVQSRLDSMKLLLIKWLELIARNPSRRVIQLYDSNCYFNNIGFNRLWARFYLKTNFSSTDNLILWVLIWKINILLILI